ncbi:MAG: iron-sulfur cluster repair di-iron protein, ric [Anaerovoracaceae bacterium]|jgi:regulator of cell morphogenesis and NO signaling|nr:iron-sulfur cluster repair di-iron protein, ric [Anaerovoracaceae bacterium]
MNKFSELKETYSEKLKLYVPVVARVHGDDHPEFHNVHEVYNKIMEKIEAGGSEMPLLSEEFKELRGITDNYTIPEGTCETFEAVYNMLSELDQAYLDQADND